MLAEKPLGRTTWKNHLEMPLEKSTEKERAGQQQMQEMVEVVVVVVEVGWKGR
jgi:hypothetical protein